MIVKVAMIVIPLVLYCNLLKFIDLEDLTREGFRNWKDSVHAWML